MIAKIPDKRRDGKSSFRDLTDYCQGKRPQQTNERVLYVNSQNIDDIEFVALEMEALASTCSRCDDPVFHLELNWREMELPTNEQVDEAVKIALEEMNLQDCQAIWGLHASTNNVHVHICVNRVHPETSKPINPAGGWTKNANERLSRKIEHTQGWDILEQSRYFVTPEGQIVKKSQTQEREDKLSQKARDIEAHTGDKSLERIAKEKASPAIQKAGSWEELHKNLAAAGITFEKKGSGAIVWIEGTAIKASKVNQAFSMSKLETRLGKFEPRHEDVVPILKAKSVPEPIEKISAQPKLKKSWDDYKKAKKEYFDAKTRTIKNLRELHKRERKDLNASQKEERTKLFSVSFVGRGTELNTKRSLKASEQKKTKLELQDNQERTIENFKKQFPLRFPSFKTWVQEEQDPRLSVMYRYANQPTLTSPLDSKIRHKDRSKIDLRDFTATNLGNNGVAYYNTEPDVRSLFSKFLSRKADFIDYGRKIVLSNNCSDSAVLAALQLGSQKWGAVTINGTNEYKNKCIELALKHNIKIANPELQYTIGVRQAQEKAKMEEQREQRQLINNYTQTKDKYQQMTAAFEQYSNAVNADRYRIVATDFTPDGIKAFILDKKIDGLNGKDKDGIIKSIPRINGYLKYNKNINIVPLSKDKHHIVIDDLTSDKLRTLRDDGYTPSCVIETSPGNHQAILSIPKLNSGEGIEREIANHLTKELNKKYGDPNLSGAVHPHRLPPFPNLKPEHRKDDGTYPATSLIEANGGICSKSHERLKEIHNHLEEIRKETSRKLAAQASNNINTGDANSAYWAHYHDIMGTRKSSSDINYSSIDGKIGIRMRITGFSASQIESTIKDNAPAMRRLTKSEAEWEEKYRNRDWGRYAKETITEFVFGPRGISYLAQSEPFLPRYKKIEAEGFTKTQQTSEQSHSKKGKNKGVGIGE